MNDSLLGVGQFVPHQLHFMRLSAGGPCETSRPASALTSKPSQYARRSSPRGIEMVGRVGAEIDAQRAVATKTGDHPFGIVAEVARRSKLDPFDQRGRFAQQIFAIGFVSGHALKIRRLPDGNRLSARDAADHLAAPGRDVERERIAFGFADVSQLVADLEHGVDDLRIPLPCRPRRGESGRACRRPCPCDTVGRSPWRRTSRPRPRSAPTAESRRPPGRAGSLAVPCS